MLGGFARCQKGLVHCLVPSDAGRIDFGDRVAEGPGLVPEGVISSRAAVPTWFGMRKDMVRC